MPQQTTRPASMPRYQYDDAARQRRMVPSSTVAPPVTSTPSSIQKPLPPAVPLLPRHPSQPVQPVEQPVLVSPSSDPLGLPYDPLLGAGFAYMPWQRLAQRRQEEKEAERRNELTELRKARLVEELRAAVEAGTVTLDDAERINSVYEKSNETNRAAFRYALRRGMSPLVAERFLSEANQQDKQLADADADLKRIRDEGGARGHKARDLLNGIARSCDGIGDDHLRRMCRLRAYARAMLELNSWDTMQEVMRRRRESRQPMPPQPGRAPVRNVQFGCAGPKPQISVAERYDCLNGFIDEINDYVCQADGQWRQTGPVIRDCRRMNTAAASSCDAAALGGKPAPWFCGNAFEIGTEEWRKERKRAIEDQARKEQAIGQAAVRRIAASRRPVPPPQSTLTPPRYYDFPIRSGV